LPGSNGVLDRSVTDSTGVERFAPYTSKGWHGAFGGITSTREYIINYLRADKVRR
jgi:hypothetical protein